jgi:hypothetical protein
MIAFTAGAEATLWTAHPLRKFRQDRAHLKVLSFLLNWISPPVKHLASFLQLLPGPDQLATRERHLHVREGVYQMGSGFSSVLPVDSYHSRRIPTFHLKNRRTFTLFTINQRG